METSFQRLKSVTYIVCGQLDLDTATESIPYVAGWGEDGALEAIQAYAQTIDEIARRIHDALSPVEDATDDHEAQRATA